MNTNHDEAANGAANSTTASPASSTTSKMIDNAKAFFAEAFDRKTRIECVRIAAYTIAFFGTLAVVSTAFGSKSA
jgi:hypothetical protein